MPATTLALTVLCLLQAGASRTEPEQLIDAGHWKRARTLVEARIHEEPGDALANFLLSQIRNAFGDRGSPLALAEKAVAIDGKTAKYHRQLAEVLGVQAQYSGIFQQLVLARRFKKEIETALALDPRDPQAMRDLVEFYLLAPGIAGGDRAKARTIAGQIAHADPAEGFSAKARLAALDGARGQTERLLRKAVEVAPANYRARIALANFYESPENESSDGAEQQARQAVHIDPGRADAYAILAGIYAAHSQWTDLDSVLAAAEREVPDDLVPNYRAALALLGLNRGLDRATVYFRKYLGVEPEGNRPTLSEAHWKLGLALEKLGHGREALAEWRESVRLDRNSPALHDLKRVKQS